MLILRHSSLSFRNSQQNERNAWHSNTRGLPVRSRRETSTTKTPLIVIKSSEDKTHVDSLNISNRMLDNKILLLEDSSVNKTTQNANVLANAVSDITSVGFIAFEDGSTSIKDTRQRSRRNVPECITNYKAQRQLLVGCTEPNVIDVRPMCNDEGEEGKFCKFNLLNSLTTLMKNFTSKCLISFLEYNKKKLMLKPTSKQKN